MSDKTSAEIRLRDNTESTAILGEYNRNLKEIEKAFSAQIVARGETVSVLLEEKARDGWRGYTREYIDAHVRTAMAHVPGDEIAVRIVSAQDGYLLGDEK